MLIEAARGGGPLGAFSTGLWRDLPGAGYYRPLVTLSLIGDAWISGSSAAGFHASNLVLHLLLVVAAWRLLRHLGGCELTAVAAAGLFAVHPVHVEAVAWISGRGDLLAPLLGCLAWLVWISGGWLPSRRRPARDRPSVGLLVGGGGVLLAALLAKESAVAFLPAMAVAGGVIGTAGDGRRPPARRRGLAAAATVGLVATTALALRVLALGSVTGPFPVDPWENPAAGAALPVRLATALGAFPRAVGLLVWPDPLRVDYGVPVLTPLAPTDPVALLGAVLLSLGVGTAACLVWTGRRRAETGLSIGIGLTLLIVSWLPVSGLGPPAGSLLAERYLVLPSLGAALAAGALVAVPAASGSPRHRSLAVGTLCAVMLLLAARSAARVPVWRDEGRLFAADLRHPPVSFRIATFQGMQAYADGRDADSRNWFARAVAAAPGFSRAWEGLARAALRQGDLPAAVEAAAEAIRQEPAGTPAVQARYRQLLAEALAAANRTDEALAVLQEAVSSLPLSPGPPRQLGDLLFREGRLTAAAGAYREAVSRSDGDPVAAYNLGVTLALLERHAEATAVLGELAGRDDAPPETYFHLGVLAQQKGDDEAAARFYRRFIATAGSRGDVGRLESMLLEARRRIGAKTPVKSGS